MVDSKEVGLAVGLVLGQHLVGMRDLHYGYWSDGLEPKLANIVKAQERYAEFLFSNMPAGVKRVLDVGSGTGRFAKLLLDRGYEVDCVSPSPFLTKYLRESVGERCEIFTCGLEEVKTDRRYDLILFSESFQYIRPSISLAQAELFLVPNGYVLLADFFRRNVPGTSPLRGGHEYDMFMGRLSRSPFKILKNLDITPQTAPTMDVVRGLAHDVGIPIRDLVGAFLRHRYPHLMKLLAWRLKEKIAKIEATYLSGAVCAASFAQFKTYRLMLLQRSSNS